MGSVTDVVRRYAPASYHALCGITNEYYSLSDLQSLADFVQFRLFSTVPGSSEEEDTWTIEENQLLGMLTTLQFIPAAVDFWGDQLSSEGGNSGAANTSVSYFDRREELWKLFDKLQKEAEALAIDLGVPAFTVKASVPKVSYGDNGRRILRTPDPGRFPRVGRDRTGYQFTWDEYWEQN